MDAAVLSPVGERIVVLADDYAEQIMHSIPTVTSPDELRKGISGALLSFLRDAVEIAA